MKLYKAVAPIKSVDSLPPQAAAIVEEIRNQGVIKRDDLLGNLEKKFNASASVQSPQHILAFYKKRLIESGYMIELTV